MELNYKLKLYSYCASHQNVMKECGEDLFKIQKYYIKDSEKKITFCPLRFFATYIKNIINLDKIHIKMRYDSLLPKEIIYEDLYLFINKKNINNIHIIRLYIRLHENFDTILNDIFDSKAYYSQYHKNIERKYNKNINLNEEKKAELFYCEFGFWNNFKLQYIHPLLFKCSYPCFIGKSDLDTIEEYFKNYSNIIFDPYIYIASNIEKLKYLIEDFDVSSKTEMKIYSHFLEKGYTKFNTNSFKTNEYLANNPKQIEKILTYNDRIYWDYNLLTDRNIAINYIKTFMKNEIKKNKFNKASFVKQFILDKNVNINKDLSINNSEEYFIVNYIKSKYVRYTTSNRYKVITFINSRIKDSIRILPMQLSKYVIDIPTI